MIAHGLPILVTLMLWWASTGVILHLDSLDRRTFVTSMLGASIVLALSLWFVTKTLDETTLDAAYVAFACGLIAWGWQLLAFYTGFVTGPRKTACAQESGQLSRFLQAVSASLYHELAAILGAFALFALSYGRPNMLAFWTYLVLWAMHASAKLNLFLGVPNLGEEMIPGHLAYLTSYMSRRPMNALFPISVTIGAIVATLLFRRAAQGDATPFEAARCTMLAALMALAVAEHWLLVMPIDAHALWRMFRRPLGAAAVEAALRFELELAKGHLPVQAGNAGDDPNASTTQPQSARAWTANPPAVCDAPNIERLLKVIAEGGFGEVDCVQGFVRTKADWVCFELSGGRASLISFAPRRLRRPLVIAKGRRFDRARLQAAFDSCAALA